jgi:uncharacterized membrane protein YkgB
MEQIIRTTGCIKSLISAHNWYGPEYSHQSHCREAFTSPPDEKKQKRRNAMTTTSHTLTPTNLEKKNGDVRSDMAELAARVVTIEDVGKAIVRWGLVLVLGWIGAMKFTAYEAMGIHPLVSHSPLLNWMYGLLSVRSFSTMLGFIEIGTAALIALRSVSPKASAVGSVLSIGLFTTTLSFLFSTPGWEPSLGFPALSAMPGQFLLKDIVLLGASVWSLGESLKAEGA